MPSASDLRSPPLGSIASEQVAHPSASSACRTAAEHPVEAGQPGRDASVARVLVLERPELDRRGAYATILDRAPRAAPGTPARPLGKLLAALATRQDRSDLAHARTLAAPSGKRIDEGTSGPSPSAAAGGRRRVRTARRKRRHPAPPG